MDVIRINQGRLGRLVSILALIGVAGCTQGPESVEPATQPVTQPATQPATASVDEAAEQLIARATAYWSARKSEDWATVFQYRTPDAREGVAESNFINWSLENEPFLTRGFIVHDARLDRNTGWIDLTTQLGMRRFPDVDAQTTRNWETWQKVDGTWYPVPSDQTELFPRSTALRDAAAEALIHDRVVASWSARSDREWSELYEFAQPEFREVVLAAEFGDALEQILFLDQKLNWIDASNGEARVFVSYLVKTADPNMQKVEPHWAHMIEFWSYVDGDWYWTVPMPGVPEEETPEAAGPKGPIGPMRPGGAS